MKRIVIRVETPDLAALYPLGLWAAAVTVIVCLLYLMLNQQLNLLLTGLVGGTIILLALVDVPLCCLVTFAYLIVMGDLRRIVSYVSGPVPFDALLLIGPVVAALIGIPLLSRIRLHDALSKTMLVLLAIMLLEIFNPQQGGIVIGLAGAVFYIVPVLWFWIGREYASPELVRDLIYRIVVPLGVAAAIIGIMQTFVGFAPWEQDWIGRVASGQLLSLHLGTSIRAFGFSISSAEYSTLLAISAAAVTAATVAGRRVWALLLPVLLASVILASARGVVLKLIIAVVCIIVLRKGHGLVPARLAAILTLSVVSLFGVGVLASHFVSGNLFSRGAQSATQNALDHELGGLAHPLNERYSTAGLHSEMFLNGVAEGVKNPLGHGLGSTTLATRLFNAPDTATSSEVDVSDMFIALGIAGGLSYLLVVCFAVRQAARYLDQVDVSISLPVLAVLACTAGAWLIGGQYSTSSIVFFLIGALTYDVAQPSFEASLANPVTS